MSLAKDYQAHPKTNRGPGGWTCPCCNHSKTKQADTKPMYHRIIRRVTKMLTKLETRRETDE
jgi:hypothetical protein